MPQKAQMPRTTILQSHTETILAGLSNSQKSTPLKGKAVGGVKQPIRVRSDLYEPIRDENHIQPQMGHQTLIPDGFCPKAWTNFR